MSLTPDHIIFRSEFHPHPPVPLLDFLTNELKVSKKYVVLLHGRGAEHLGRMWRKHVHLLGIVEPDKDYFDYIKSSLDPKEDIWLSNKTLEEHPLDEDSIDTVVLLNMQTQEEGWKNELSRVLRLNSYVVRVNYALSTDTERTFSWAFSQFFRQYSSAGYHEYEQLPEASELDQFYAEGYQEKVFPNQIRLHWDSLQAYYLASDFALTADDPKFKTAMKALKIIFEQYQIEAVVSLDYQTHVYYGLFNKNVPAISLRKNLFFTILRPFAFAFYLLVKFNIYLLRSLYILRPKKEEKSEKE
jgi:hypothetical protein